jgi:two-component system response regulator LytT
MVIVLAKQGGRNLLRVVLVDDERCVLEELEYLLQGKVEVAGKFTNPMTAIENIAVLAPDAVFLDVELPGINGLEAATEILALLPATVILFITAYSHYAAQAFELNAVDYLVKPVQPDRLNQALERIRRRLAEGRQEEAANKLFEWLHASLAVNRCQTVHLWRGRHLEIVPVDKISCCFLPKNERQVSVVVEGQVYQATGGLINFVTRVGLEHLLRCHRSYYLNPGLVVRLEPGEAETYNAYLADFDEPIPISRNYRREILSALQMINNSIKDREC